MREWVGRKWELKSVFVGLASPGPSRSRRHGARCPTANDPDPEVRWLTINTFSAHVDCASLRWPLLRNIRPGHDKISRGLPVWANVQTKAGAPERIIIHHLDYPRNSVGCEINGCGCKGHICVWMGSDEQGTNSGSCFPVPTFFLPCKNPNEF